MTFAANLLAGLVVLLWLVWRQTTPRPFDPTRGAAGVVPLLALGLLQLGHSPAAAHARTTAVALVAASVVAAGVFGLLRGSLMRVWRSEDGRTWRAGTAGSVALWLLPVALHLLADRQVARVDPAASGLGAASLLLYLAVSLGAQRVSLTRRANALAPATPPAWDDARLSRR